MRSPSPVPRLGLLAALVSCALVSCVLLAGCGGSSAAVGPRPSPTATPKAPTPLAGFSLYRSPDGVYALAFPVGWASAAENGSEGGLTVKNGVSFISPDKAANLQLQPLNQSVAAGDYGVFVQSLAISLGASAYAPGKADPIVTTSATIGAHTWTELDGSMTLAGKSYRVKQFGTPHDGATVLVIAIALSGSFQRFYDADFRPMLASITFFT
jgi:hypothetical protein